MAEQDVHINHHLTKEDLTHSPTSGGQRRHIFEHFNDVHFDHSIKNRTKMSQPEQQVRSMLRVRKSSVVYSMDSSSSGSSSQSP